MKNTSTTRVWGKDDAIKLLDLGTLIAENLRLLIYGSLLAGLVALGAAFLITPTFTAKTTILPPHRQQSTLALLASQLGTLSGLAGAAGINIKDPADLYVALLKSRTIADHLIKRFNLMQVYDAEWQKSARETLASATSISSEKNGLITIEVDDSDPKRAADMANAYVQELFRLNGKLAITDAQQRRTFFEKELKTAREALSEAEAKLAEVGVSKALVKASPEAIVASIAKLQAQITAQEIKLSTMRSYATEQSPEYRLAKAELASLRTQLAQTEVSESPKKNSAGADYLNRYRNYQYQQTLFEIMLQQYEAARLDEAREGATIQVVDPALPPERKSKPRKALIAILATLSTGVILFLFLLVRESFRNAQKDLETASKLTRIRGGFRRLLPHKRQSGPSRE